MHLISQNLFLTISHFYLSQLKQYLLVLNRKVIYLNVIKQIAIDSHS